MSGGSSRRYPPELRERAVRMVAEISDQHDSEWAAISEVARLLGVGTAETWILDQLRLHGNSHRFNTHHYQLNNASYSVAQGNCVATAAPTPLLNVSAPCSLFLFHRMRPLTTCVPKSRNTYRFATFR